MKLRTLVFSLLLLTLPSFVIASGLVPCGDPGQPACQTCHLYQLVQEVTRWIFGLAATVTTIIIIYGGFRLSASAGNAVAKSDARKIISAAVVGLILIGSALFIIEFVLSSLAGYSDGIGASLQCVAQPTAAEGG